jgi:hypothetical protein
VPVKDEEEPTDWAHLALGVRREDGRLGRKSLRLLLGSTTILTWSIGSPQAKDTHDKKPMSFRKRLVLILLQGSMVG